MATATQPAAGTPPATSAKQQFIDVWTRENVTTRRVLTALPNDLGEFRPADACNTAREIAFIFAIEQGVMIAALSNQWQWPPKRHTAPATYAEVVEEFDTTSAALKDLLVNSPESRLFETVTFFTGPRQTGEVPVIQLLWFMLMGGVHHRGQLSVYLRAAGAKVPSIYGPSKDEPWT